MLNETQEERRSTIKQFWKSHEAEKDHDSHSFMFAEEYASHYWPLVEIVLQRAEAVADAEGLDAAGFEEKLLEAERIVWDITYALRAHWKDPPDRKFWYLVDESVLMYRPKEWTGASPIQADDLDKMTARYLDRPWLQSNRIDWYILNGFIVNEMLCLLDSIRSATALGRINWADLLLSGTISSSLWLLGLGTAVITFLDWLLLPTLAAIAYYFDYASTLQKISGIFVVWCAVRILFVPMPFMPYLARKRRLIDLQRILQSSLVSTLNPTLLRERLREVEKDTTEKRIVHTAVYSILDRAIARDPAVFTVQFLFGGRFGV